MTQVAGEGQDLAARVEGKCHSILTILKVRRR